MESSKTEVKEKKKLTNESAGYARERKKGGKKRTKSERRSK